jgi:hypothetical protein
MDEQIESMPKAKTFSWVDFVFWQVSGVLIGGTCGLAAAAWSLGWGSSSTFTAAVAATPFLAAVGGIIGTVYGMRGRRNGPTGGEAPPARH